MLDKRALTKKFLKELGLETTAKNIKQYHRTWWMNPRNMDTTRSYRLTPEGCNMLINQLEVKHYEVNFPGEIEWYSGLLLDLDKNLDSPYFLKSESIVIFKEKMAVELILFEGNIHRYTQAKILSQKNNDHPS
jgi:hypothetical protein